jgi:hypothetical protein
MVFNVSPDSDYRRCRRFTRINRTSRREYLPKQSISVRAFVHKLAGRSDELRLQGAEIIEGDLLNPASVGSRKAVMTATTARMGGN